MNDMPDPDAIKMFVGQIPKNWNENDVRIHFEEFGRIYLINVLRDKVTKQSRGEWLTFENRSALLQLDFDLKNFRIPLPGCCFITYYTRKAALDAQNACHNLKTLPGVSVALLMF